MVAHTWWQHFRQRLQLFLPYANTARTSLSTTEYELLPVSNSGSSPSRRRTSRHGVICAVITLSVLLGLGIVSIKYSETGIEVGFPDLRTTTLEQLSNDLSKGRFTSVNLVQAYLARIKEVNDKLHAITEINPEALTIAAALDLERSKGFSRGPMHGIPVLLKDNIATDDQLNTTAGSFALLGTKVPRDATVVKMLRTGGAIILGKASMTEWAYMRSLNMSNGWSARGGQVFSPYFPDADPEGSSSGCGVATALGLSMGCLGTETDGSIISPASSNNVVGIKPTMAVGLTSRYLVVPISEHQDSVGPIAGTVKDAAYILQAISGPDYNDNYTSAISEEFSYDFVNACKSTALMGSRIGVPRNVLPLFTNNATSFILQAFKQSLEAMRASGAFIVEDTNFTSAEQFFDIGSSLETTVLNADFSTGLTSYLKALVENPHRITSLTDLRNLTQALPSEEYPLRDTLKWDSALQQGWNNTSPRFWPTYQQLLHFGGEGGLLGALERHNLDAVVLPTHMASSWAAVVGSPIVSVPMGAFPMDAPVVRESWGLATSAPNIPFGISFLGGRFSEKKLIGLAYAFEQTTKTREKTLPYIMPHTGLADIIAKGG